MPTSSDQMKRMLKNAALPPDKQVAYACDCGEAVQPPPHQANLSASMQYAQRVRVPAGWTWGKVPGLKQTVVPLVNK